MDATERGLEDLTAYRILTSALPVLLQSRHKITVRYDDRTPITASFNKEDTWAGFLPDSNRENLKLGPPKAGRSTDFEAFLTRLRPNPDTQVSSLLKPAFLGVRSP